MKLYTTVCTAMIFSLILPLSSPANAGIWEDFRDNTADQLRQIDPTPLLREGGRTFDKNVIQPVGDAIKEGLESTTKICSQVGVDTCVNPSFQNAYLALKLAASAKIINNADTCGALVKTLATGGETGIQAYGLYNGIAIPNEIAKSAVSGNEKFGYSSCEIIYGQQPNLSRMVKTSEGAVVTEETYQKIKGTAIGEPTPANSSISSPNSSISSPNSSISSPNSSNSLYPSANCPTTSSEPSCIDAYIKNQLLQLQLRKQ